MSSSAREVRDGIRVESLSKRFGEIVALDDVTLSAHSGEFLCIVGPSGCGKTTLLHLLAALEAPSQGTIQYNIDRRDRPLQSMVFQEQGIFPWMTVLDNAAFGLMTRGVPRRKREEIVDAFLAKFGLLKFRNAYPYQLSGGMRQRVNLVRAFANDPAVLLMDEPLGSLDEQTKMLVQEDLLKLWEGTGKTVVFITHSLDEAVVLADRVAVMSHRPGRIKQIFDVALPRPRNALELRNDPHFVEVRAGIWEALRSEVLGAMESTHAGA